MANRKIANTFLSITADVNTTSEAASFPASNAVDRSSPQKHWRTTVTTDSRLVIDLGATQTNLTCYLDWLNFTSFKYQESSAATGPWTDVGTTLTVEKDPIHGVYRRMDDIALGTNRYLGIFIPGQTPVDNASYFRVGTFAIPTSVVELDALTEVEYPLNYTLPESHIVQNSFPGGQTEKIKLGNLQPMTISFDLTSTVKQNLKGANITEIGDLLRDPTSTIFLDFNLGQSWQAYLVKKSGDLSGTISTPNTGTAEFGSVLMEVII